MRTHAHAQAAREELVKRYVITWLIDTVNPSNKKHSFFLREGVRGFGEREAGVHFTMPDIGYGLPPKYTMY